MPARVLDGAALSRRMREDLQPLVRAFTNRAGRPPGLALVLVGDDPASHVYVGSKRTHGTEVGFRVDLHQHPASMSLDAVLALVRSLNEDDAIDGILVQSPLPAAMGPEAARRVFETIDPAKDVDGFTSENVGRLVQNREGLVACTPAGVMELLAHAGVELEGARVAVIGRSILVGKPVAALLLAANATVTHCHSRTRDLGGVCRESDVIVAAVGRPNTVTADMVREGAVVIDVGTNRVDGKLVGDVDYEAVSQKAAAITPVPGGVGPMTRAMLLVNTVRTARAQTVAAPAAAVRH